MNDGPRPSRRRLALHLAALAIVIGGHGLMRVQTARTTPYEARTFYSRDYHVALAIMLGRGFELLRLDTPASQPLLDFTLMRTERLDRADLEAFDRVDRLRPADEPDSRKLSQRNELSRTFDMYVAAGLWSIFGIDWRVHTAFYIGLSMACGVLVFLVARRLTGSFGCGLLAAALFALSPYESRYAIVSIRDCSPLWSTIIAYAAVLCLADRFRSPWLNGLSYVAAGVAATVGLGWRPDVIVLAPVALVTLVAVMFWRRRRPVRIVAAALLFAIGAKGTMLVIADILPDDLPRAGRFQLLHVAYYADATRSNLLGYEDSFQTLRHDTYVFTLARALHESDPPGERRAWDMTLHGSTYSDLMVRLFRDMAVYHLRDWMLSMPRVWMGALVRAADPERAHPVRYHLWLPWAALIGGVAGVFAYRRQAPAVLSILGFWLAYGVLFLVVLPEGKHLAPFVFPLIVLGAIGLWLPFHLLAARRGRTPPDAEPFAPPLRWRPRWVAGGAVTGVALVVVALIAAGAAAGAKRRDYLDAVRDRARTATEAPATIVDPRVFTVRAALAEGRHEGFLLDIAAADRPGTLVLRHRPEPPDSAVAFETRHPLAAGREQHFFFTVYPGWRPVGQVAGLYTVRLTGAAQILRARRVDLATWGRLPFATVFTDPDEERGSPRLDDGPAVQLIDVTATTFDAWGLTESEALVTRVAPASRVVAGRDDPACRVEAVPGSEASVTPSGTWIRTSPEPSRYAATFGLFTAPETGRYVFRLETRIDGGDLVFGLLSSDRSRWMPLAATARDIVPGGEVTLVVCDLAAGEGVVPTISNPGEGGVSAYLVRGLEIRTVVRD